MDELISKDFMRPRASSVLGFSVVHCIYIIEPRHEISNNVVCATSKGSDQPAHMVRLLTRHHLEFLSFKGCCTGSSESTHVKIPHVWKSHIMAHITLTMFICHIFDEYCINKSRKTCKNLTLHYIF